ncbi:SpoIID/LytB domain-containing protein [Nocardioides sp. URHA0020]|uniref:SpoIID/LytB domain-containing protein n=1 Tax=Nocardioides sp. URHA0020 TaxID=1380392 RepID=UPI00048AEF01|nr:SpoIID/LytB domain-containing protein [Nocardioides sp. URHA0020]
MRRALLPAWTAVLCLGLVLAPSAPVAAADSGATAQRAVRSWDVAGPSRVTVSGHGFGHGHGMSQYGAEGAARQGLTYRQIASFYYPGTTWATSAGRVVVQLTRDTTPSSLMVRAASGLTLRDTAATGRTALPANGAKRWRVTTDARGVSRVSYLTDRWRAWATLKGRGEFFAGGAPITLMTSTGDRAYRGRLRTAVTASGTRVTVNDLTLDNYLRGVVPLEMPALWSPAAVRAQAVAARTYAAYERAHPISSAYQICDTSSCQVYGGYDAEHPATDRAIAATRGRILTSRGEPAFTQFGSSSGGWTSAGSVPYLSARQDPYDDWSGNPVHDWKERLTDATLERAWPKVGDLTRIAVTSRDGNGAWGGRVRSITLVGTRGRVVVGGDDFRSRLGLRSTWLTFSVAPR